MSNYRLKFISLDDALAYDKLFEERRKDDNITFSDFRDISVNNLPFSKTLTYDILEVLKKSKDRINSIPEGGINLSNFISNQAKQEYFDFLDRIYMEENKRINLNDPETKTLFNLLSKGSDSIPKKYISDIIYQFELPMKIDDFFYFLEKKDTIYFEDFCVLLRSSRLTSTFSKVDDVMCGSNPNVDELSD